MRMPRMYGLILAAFLPAIGVCASEISGNWIAQVAGNGDPQYFRLELRAEGTKLAGKMNEWKLAGSVKRGSNYGSGGLWAYWPHWIGSRRIR